MGPDKNPFGKFMVAVYEVVFNKNKREKEKWGQSYR